MIYFIQQGDDDGPIKIGYTSGNPERRMADLQTGSPQTLHLIAAGPGTRTDEQRLHARLHPYRIGGEWFAPSDALVLVIAEVCGAPPPSQRWASSTTPADIEYHLARLDPVRFANATDKQCRHAAESARKLHYAEIAYRAAKAREQARSQRNLNDDHLTDDDLDCLVDEWTEDQDKARGIR